MAAVDVEDEGKGGGGAAAAWLSIEPRYGQLEIKQQRVFV